MAKKWFRKQKEKEEKAKEIKEPKKFSLATEETDGNLTKLAKATARAFGTYAEEKYIKWYAKEENISIGEAYDICHGRTNPVDYKATLGLKMSNPIIMKALRTRNRTKRENAIANLKDLCCPEEIEELDKYLAETGGNFYSKAKYEEKVQKRKAKQITREEKEYLANKLADELKKEEENLTDEEIAEMKAKADKIAEEEKEC